MARHRHTETPSAQREGGDEPVPAAAADSCAPPAAPSRRHAVGLVGAAAVGAVALSACGSGGGDDAAAPSAPATPTDVAAAADVPVGSGISVNTNGVQAVVGHPAEDTFTAYSPVCPHQGCTVNPGQKQFVCPCHNSVFDMSSGDVTGGPAQTGLTPYPVKVEKGRVIVG